ncbi:MAG: hypothetical protein WKF37_17610 [Bryobacteraceae bacterium]
MAANSTHENVLVAGIAGLVGGNVDGGWCDAQFSPADTEQTELTRELGELEADDERNTTN